MPAPAHPAQTPLPLRHGSGNVWLVLKERLPRGPDTAWDAVTAESLSLSDLQPGHAAALRGAWLYIIACCCTPILVIS